MLLPLLSAQLPAQQPDTTMSSISGVVVNSLRAPIEGAEIGVPGTGMTTFSSATGSFLLRVPVLAELLVRIRRPGYKSQLLKLRPPWSGAIELQQGVFELPEIKVTARNAKPAEYASTTKYDDFFRRRRQGFGLFIERSDIERRAPTRVAELLQGRAGVRVDLRMSGASGGTIVRFVRCSEFPPKINVYIDGRRQMPDGKVMMAASASGNREGDAETKREAQAVVGTMLDRIAIGDIELIEVFRGPGELPPEFNDGNCGAIAVWTRQGGR
ncbi:MAG TPA: TonB-dependent receptor [Gemmatimonadales bacterium]|nr:TonB-dependent receptor [Gemmatimonadales bacterium]